MSSAAYALPKTPQSAPPNFYSQAGSGSAGGSSGSSSAGGPGGSSSGPGTPGSGMDPNEEHSQFVTNMGKLLTVMNKMEKIKPNGVDISKYMKAASQVLKDCMEQVATGGEDTPDASATAADQTSAPANVGSTTPGAGVPTGGTSSAAA